MIKIFVIKGYLVYFLLTGKDELIHVRISNKDIFKGSIKLWLLVDNTFVFADDKDKSKIPDKDLSDIMLFLSRNSSVIINLWKVYRGSEKYL